jgi:peptide chain release factor 2
VTSQLQQSIHQTNQELTAQIGRLNLPAAQRELDELRAQAQQSDFWANQEVAQRSMKQIHKLELKIQPWQELKQKADELQELVGLDDAEITAELSQEYDRLLGAYQLLKKELQFSGKYDDFDVVMSIHAGAGGDDAQDWAYMLMRMYVRWAEQHQFDAAILQESPGETAGIKSATIEISGRYVYGRLKGEHGVHRLVRLSPFNSDNLRQTSFAKVEITPKLDQPDALAIDEKELKIDVYRSSGKGGQSVNTTDSAVRITHAPTGIVVAIQNERSQLQNKETAMTILRSKLAQLQLQQHAEKLSELKGPNQSAEWGNQIRSYVLHPYKQVKDLRTRHESSDPDAVLDGDIDGFIETYLEHMTSSTTE